MATTRRRTIQVHPGTASARSSGDGDGDGDDATTTANVMANRLTAPTIAKAICRGTATRHLRLGGGAAHSHNGALLGMQTFGAPGWSIQTSGGTSRIGGLRRTAWTSGGIGGSKAEPGRRRPVQ
jgi:hypothetical protein